MAQCGGRPLPRFAVPSRRRRALFARGDTVRHGVANRPSRPPQADEERERYFALPPPSMTDSGHFWVVGSATAAISVRLGSVVFVRSQLRLTA